MPLARVQMILGSMSLSEDICKGTDFFIGMCEYFW